MKIEFNLTTFRCNQCGYTNNEIKFDGKITEFGVKIVCKIISSDHLKRSVVMSEFASFKIPELNLEIHSKTHNGSMASIEGIIAKYIETMVNKMKKESQSNLNEPDIGDLIGKAQKGVKGEILPLTLILEDHTGNCFIENPFAPLPDIHTTIDKYVRTEVQQEVSTLNK